MTANPTAIVWLTIFIDSVIINLNENSFNDNSEDNSTETDISGVVKVVDSQTQY